MSPGKVVTELIMACAGLLSIVGILVFSKLARALLVEAIRNPRSISQIETADHDDVRPQVA